jgi:putative transport protein
VTFTTLLVGYRIMGMPFEYVMGLASGVHTQPAALAMAGNMTRNEAPNTGYTSVYPAAMILKILLAQLLLIWGS